MNGERYHVNSNQKKVGVLLTLDIEDSSLSKVIRNKEGDYIIIREQVLQEDIMILNTYVPNNRVPKYMR